MDNKKCKGLEMSLNTLEGWLLMEHQGHKAATNGVVMVEFEQPEEITK